MTIIMAGDSFLCFMSMETLREWITGSAVLVGGAEDHDLRRCRKFAKRIFGRRHVQMEDDSAIVLPGKNVKIDLLGYCWRSEQGT